VDPPFIAKLKSKVRKFELLTSSLHPKYQARMRPLLKRPFIVPLKPNYISFHMGTIVNQRYKKFPAPSSLSLLDLRMFSQDGQFSDDESSEEEIIMFNESHGVPIHKSNSYYTLQCLGTKAQLRKPLKNKFSKIDLHLHRKALKKEEQRRWNVYDLSSSDESDEETGDDAFSELEFEDSFTMDEVLNFC
jgi:hypothetical protein